jgi:hypothetical protein
MSCIEDSLGFIPLGFEEFPQRARCALVSYEIDVLELSPEEVPGPLRSPAPDGGTSDQTHRDAAILRDLHESQSF